MVQKGVISLQVVLVAIVLTMAVTGIGLLVYNSFQYQSLVTANNKKSVTNFLVKQADHLIDSSISKITDVAMKLQSKSGFRNALRDKRYSTLRRLVDNEFNQYLFTTGEIDLQRIYVFDKDLNLLAKSRKGMHHKDENHIMCGRIVELARIRAGINRLKSLSKFCEDSELAHLAILNTVGGFKAQGYLLYVVNPASLLSSLGSRLGMATQILNPNGVVAHVTADWEEMATKDQTDLLNVYHAIKDDNHNPVLFINVLHDLREFNASLHQTEKSSLNTAILIFSIALALSFVLLHAVMKALRSLKQGAQSLSKGEFNSVGKTRISEFNVLIEAFNGMASDITSLIDKLNKARQDSEQANQSKSVFLANMSHEIRTPMNAVLGYTQILLRDGQLPQQYRRPLESVEKAGNHLLALINDILDLSKIEAGAIELHPEDFSIYELIDGMSEMFEFRCKQTGLTWNLENHLKSDGLVHGDQNKLRQVLVNFLSNAVKFTTHGSITLSVEENNEFYDFAVIDTGMGISSADMMNVIKPFQQAEAGIKKGGTGLGLAISKRQLEIMGSELHMLSQPGKGSKFYFSIYLPAARNAVINRRLDRSNSSRVLQSGQSVDALVIDDVEDNRNVLSHLLQTSGVAVRAGVNGEEAVNLVREKTPDIVFMDIRMPVMGGTEAMEQIKREFPDVTCVAVTSSVLYHERAGYLERGFDDLIGKPFRFDQVINSMEDLLGVTFVSVNEEQHEQKLENSENTSEMDISNIILPEEIHSRLMEAAEINAITDMQLIVDELRKLNSESRYLAEILEKHINNYETDDIVNLLEEVRCA